MTHEAGKGDKQRPTNHEAYSNNYDLIWGKKKQENFEDITCQRCGKTLRVNTMDEYSGIHTCTPQHVAK